MVIYALGKISYQLIRLDKDNKDALKNLSKLNILQSGVESRFIPSLTADTKQ